MANYRWLQEQLRGKRWLDVDEHSSDLLRVQYGNQSYLIYAAAPGDYIVTIDTVQKAEELGANTVVYGSGRCRASAEALAYGKQHGIRVLNYAALFRRLRTAMIHQVTSWLATHLADHRRQIAVAHLRLASPQVSCTQ